MGSRELDGDASIEQHQGGAFIVGQDAAHNTGRQPLHFQFFVPVHAVPHKEKPHLSAGLCG